MRRNVLLPVVLASFTAVCVGCQSYAGNGALLGGATGAGIGALVGHATGNTGAGAAIGAGVGALTGAAVGSGMDDIEARNRAQIAAQMHQEIRAGAVTIQDVVNMTHAGVDPALIIQHVRSNGMVAPLQSADLIYLQQQNVAPLVVAAMQEPPRQVIVQGAPEPAYYYGDPYYYHHPHYYDYGYRPRVSYGVVIR